MNSPLEITRSQVHSPLPPLTTSRRRDDCWWAGAGRKWRDRFTGRGDNLSPLPKTTVASRISRFCKTGESAKSAKAEADDPDDEKAGPDPYQMVRAGLNRGLSVEAIADKETLPVNLVQAIALQGKADARGAPRGRDLPSHAADRRSAQTWSNPADRGVSGRPNRR